MSVGELHRIANALEKLVDILEPKYASQWPQAEARSLRQGDRVYDSHRGAIRTVRFVEIKPGMNGWVYANITFEDGGSCSTEAGSNFLQREPPRA